MDLEATTPARTLSLPLRRAEDVLTDSLDEHAGRPAGVAPTWSSHSHHFRPACQASFFAMERRRLQRQTFGSHVSKGLAATAMELSMFLGVAMYSLASLRQHFFGPPRSNFRYLAIPIVLTVGVVLTGLQHSWYVPENLALLWCKIWVWLFVIWLLWFYDSTANRCQGDSTINALLNPWEIKIFSVFVALETATLVIWLLLRKLYPWFAECLYMRSMWFWRIRASSTMDGWSSYVPNGPCCSRRCHFTYMGDQTAEGTPHGHGVWCDDSYHGEVLEGEWRNGIPVAPFVSRVSGSGAISIAQRVGYGTARAEGLSNLYCCPRRSQEATLRYGTINVECSAAGCFLAHLPKADQPCTFDNIADMFPDLRDGRLSLRRTNNGSSIIGPSIGRYYNGNSPSHNGSTIGEVPQPPDRDLTTVLIFVHGYNCPLDWACMRIGQLLTLGKFSPEVIPLVFSWPTGKLFSYFQVKKHLGRFAGDLPRLIMDLRAANVGKIHLVAHSLGCEVVTSALPELISQLDSLNGDEGQRLEISTVTFFNATNSLEQFLAPSGDLQKLLTVCGRVTLYCNRFDGALKALEILGWMRSIGRHVKPINFGVESSRVDIVDCTSMDANVNSFRHSYFDLNTHVVGDFQELISTGRPASSRSRLLRTSPYGYARRHSHHDSNVFVLLAPPVHVSW